MDVVTLINELTTEICSRIIKENDTLQAPKTLHLRNWCAAFSMLFKENKVDRLPFFLEILSEDDCWENTNTIHRIKLNRRKIARRMVQPQNSRGRFNPLYFQERYLIACLCCLEENIRSLFQEFKQDQRVDVITASQMFIREFSQSEPLAIYWTYILSGGASKMNLGDKNLYEYGLYQVFNAPRSCVEAVEFFWDKIKSEDQLSSQRKKEILVKTTVIAAEGRFWKHPEITEFLVTELNPDWCSEVFSRQYETGSLIYLKENLCFDLFWKFLDGLQPNEVSYDLYYDVLKFSGIKEYPPHYTHEARRLFMYVWNKEEFHKHRRYVLNEEFRNEWDQGLLISLTNINYLEALWAIFRKAELDEIKAFMKTTKANYIAYLLKERNDEYSLQQFELIKHGTRRSESPNTNCMDKIILTMNEDSIPSTTKRRKKE